MPEEEVGKQVGVVTGYLGKLGVAIVELTDTLKAGQKIKIKGHTTDLEQVVESMQIEKKTVPEAKKGDCIGLKVSDKCRDHDKVYVVE